MACLVACEAETCVYNVDGQCEKVGGIVINYLWECNSYTLPDPIDLGLNSKEKE